MPKKCVVCGAVESEYTELFRQDDGAYWCTNCCHEAADYSADELCLCEGEGCETCEGTGLVYYEQPYYPPRNI